MGTDAAPDGALFAKAANPPPEPEGADGPAFPAWPNAEVPALANPENPPVPVLAVVDGDEAPGVVGWPKPLPPKEGLPNAVCPNEDCPNEDCPNEDCPNAG